MPHVMMGVINLDKPERISSAAAVSRVKRLLPRGVKIGHAGTLDPFATGVLVLLIGKATRLSEHYMAQPKQYLAQVKLGATTDTLDPESPEQLIPPARPIEREDLLAVLPRFIGTIQQRPPVYSALKIGGRAAYKLTRKGQQLDLPARPVTVHGIELLDWRWPLADLRIDCGRGTYIRSLARDIGEALGTAGYLTTLRRTRVGECRIDSAVTLEQLATDGVEGYLIGVER